MKSAIQFEQVVKKYAQADLPALNGLSFQVERGSVYGLLGPNGAGKSTSVMMLCGLLKVDSGSIHVLDCNAQTESEKIRKQVGIAPQEIALFPTLTAAENLIYFGKMYGVASAQLKEKMDLLFHTFQLEDKRNKAVHTFSGGMKRRLNLMAALLHQPELLILDEPTVGVDVQSRNLIIDFLKKENEKGLTILYSSHLMEEAERLCHRVGILHHGKLVAQGSVDELFNQYHCTNLEEVFLLLTGKSIREQ